MTVDLRVLADAVLAEWRQHEAAAQLVDGASTVGADAEEETW